MAVGAGPTSGVPSQIRRRKINIRTYKLFALVRVQLTPGQPAG